MIDLRIYRAAILPALCALVVVMFSVESVPGPRRAQISPENFDSTQAVRLARAVVNAGSERTPGSRGNAAAADLVEEQFRSIQADQVSIQRYRDSFRGQEVDLENVVLVLPGDSDGRLVLVAHRDSASGAGGTTSAAATGVLLELARAFDNVDHHKTLVFVSSDGGSAGGSGAHRFAREFPGANSVDAAIVLSALGVERPQRPFLEPWSASVGSTSAQLVESAAAAIEDQVASEPGGEGAFGRLARLALPIGLGEAAVLIADGFDAIEITATGDRLPPASQDSADRISQETMDDFGRAALSLMLALDVSDQPLEHGPDSYVRVGDKLVPGWALALLAASLLLPVGAAAVDGIARASRRGQPVLRHLAWIATRALPFACVLLLAYALAFLGLIPDPGFPFDPARFPLDAGGVIVLVVLAVAFGLAWALIKPLRLPPTLRGEAIAAPLALVLFAASMGIWLANPFMALLLVPAVNLWMLAAIRGTRLRPLPAVAVGLCGLLLPLLVVVHLASSWEVGWRVPWDLLLMVTGGHLGFATTLMWCLIGGCLLALAAIVAGGTVRRSAHTLDASTRRRNLSPMPAGADIGDDGTDAVLSGGAELRTQDHSPGKVQLLRERVATDGYRVDSRAVAEAIIRRLAGVIPPQAGRSR